MSEESAVDDVATRDKSILPDDIDMIEDLEDDMDPYKEENDDDMDPYEDENDEKCSAPETPENWVNIEHHLSESDIQQI